MVMRVREAISAGTNPRMINLGTSGAYFVYEQRDGTVNVVGIFKPMDEEPYGNLKYAAYLT